MKKVIVMLLWSQAAFAGLTLTLTPTAQPAAPGAEVLFSGTLTNTSATERLFLNDITFTPTPPNVTALSSNAFFANVPGILLPGETYGGPLFRISLSTAPPQRRLVDRVGTEPTPAPARSSDRPRRVRRSVPAARP